MVDLSKQNGAFVRRDSEAIADVSGERCDIVRNTIGNAHEANHESGARTAVFKINSPLPHGKTLKLNSLGGYFDSSPLSRESIQRPGSAVFV